MITQEQWSRIAWAEFGVPLLRRLYPKLMWRCAQPFEDTREATDYHVRLGPHGKVLRFQWRALRYQGFETFTIRAYRDGQLTGEAEGIFRSLVANDRRLFWCQAYFLPGPDGKPLACKVLAVAPIEEIIQAYTPPRRVNRAGGHVVEFGATPFSCVGPRQEWRPNTGWQRYSRSALKPSDLRVLPHL